MLLFYLTWKGLVTYESNVYIYKYHIVACDMHEGQLNRWHIED